VVLLTAGCVGVAWVLTRRYPHRGRPPAFRFWITAAFVFGIASYLMIMELQSSDRLVSDYCSYGAVSQAQLDGCKSHVTANEVRGRNTPAAHFAKSGSSDDVCGAISGPFCQRVLDGRYLEDQELPPGQ
jgi:hypothetical protein